LGLVLDPEASRALSKGYFLELAASRGYTVAVAVGDYARFIDGWKQKGSQGPLWAISAQDLKNYSLQRIDADPQDDIALYRIVPLHGRNLNP
jgi:hypothetical protein